MCAILEAEHLAKAYRRKLRKENSAFWKRQYEIKQAVGDISFTIEVGELVGLVGMNGAGKSTLLKLLLGILSPDSGEAKMFGRDSFRFRKKNASLIGANFGQKSSLVWDLPFLYSLELNQKIYQIPNAQFQQTLDELDRFLQIKELLNIPVRLMSLGQRMRCEFAAITLHAPKLLILDESTIGLDILVKKKIEDYLNYINAQRNVTVLFSTHDLAEMERICSRFLLVNNGKLLLDDKVANIPALSQYSYLSVRTAGECPCQIEEKAGLTVVGHTEQEWKIRIDRAVLSEQEVMAELINRMPMENISAEKQSLEDFIYHLVQEK